MADVELVIKIPEEDFERCKKRFQMRIDIMGNAIANGTPLPKGHGRLIDADALYKDFSKCTCKCDCGYLICPVCSQLTIIEADNESEEDEQC